MGYTLSYRSSHPVGPEQDAAIRQAADSVNQGRTWVLTFLRDVRDGHLFGAITYNGKPDGDRAARAASTWPGPFEGKQLLDALCSISRDCGVDWKIRDDTCLRPIGVIHAGVCHADQEAMAESARNRGEILRRKAGG